MIEADTLQERIALFRPIVLIQDHPIETVRLAQAIEFVDPNQLTGKVEAQKAGTVTLGDSHNLNITFQKMVDGTQRIRLRIAQVGEPIEKKGKLIRPEILQIDAVAIITNSRQLPTPRELPIIITAFAQYHNLQSRMGLKTEKILHDTTATLTAISQKNWT